MPGGGKLISASVNANDIHVNNRGDVVFSGVVDTNVNSDGNDDTGLFQWSYGQLGVIARTGTVILGVGTLFALALVQILFPQRRSTRRHSERSTTTGGRCCFAPR